MIFGRVQIYFALNGIFYFHGGGGAFNGWVALGRVSPERGTRTAAVSAAHAVQTGRPCVFSAIQTVHRKVNQKRGGELPLLTAHAVSRRDGGAPTAWIRLNLNDAVGAPRFTWLGAQPRNFGELHPSLVKARNGEPKIRAGITAMDQSHREPRETRRLQLGLALEL